ncbi:MAG TPA: hypothetical protein VE083_09690 [Terriglobales bacterium]|nr:hypothetical protein [Terriglobales bacterium]
MDSYHRQPLRKDYRTGRDCQFCLEFDPDFAKRRPIDRCVEGDMENSATSHLSEDGHVRHRMFELAQKRAQTVAASTGWVKSA